MTAQNEQAAMLGEVMGKTATLLAGVTPDQLNLPTPCTEWNVQQLEDHLVGWARHFSQRESGADPDGDPFAYHVEGDAVAPFTAASDALVAAIDRKITTPPDPLPEGATPAPLLAVMLIGEYVVHGWDLATATGQAVPFTDREAEVALGMSSMLTPELRGQMFGPEVPAPADATPLERLIAFAGRRPR